MPADDRVRCDDRQVLTPAGAPAPSQDPEQLVPEAQPSAWTRSSWPRQDSTLMAQEHIFDDEIVALARPSQDGHEQQREQFKHTLSIADVRRARYCRRTPAHRPAL